MQFGKCFHVIQALLFNVEVMTSSFLLLVISVPEIYEKAAFYNLFLASNSVFYTNMGV